MWDSPFQDPAFSAWTKRELPSSGVTIRQAVASPTDGRWMRWIQAGCESTFIHSEEDNRAKIEKKVVMLAEADEVPIGFCISQAGQNDDDPLFVQLIAVVPWARRRGAGLALISAAAELEPHRNVAVATLDTNFAATELNIRFAESIGASIKRVPLRKYRRSDLGFAAGELHRPWIIERPLP